MYNMAEERLAHKCKVPTVRDIEDLVCAVICSGLADGIGLSTTDVANLVIHVDHTALKFIPNWYL